MLNKSEVAVPDAIEASDSILLPDPTDAQFMVNYHRQIQGSGEKRLVYAVLENGIHQLQFTFGQKSRTEYNLFREAYNWIFTSDASYIFSFDNCCYLLDLNPEYLREQLKKYLHHVGWVDATDFYRRRRTRKIQI